MARKLMRSQLNQVRAWVRQGRTDAWIAHQLDVSASELREFIRRNDLAADDDTADDSDLRDEIEAEIEATMDSEEPEYLEDEDSDDEGSDEGSDDEDAKPKGGRARERAGDGEGPGGGRRRRRRRRRGGKRAGVGLEATFDHGETDGFGVWLDPAVETDPVYGEHWKGHRKLEVTIEPDQIIIRRAGD